MTRSGSEGSQPLHEQVQVRLDGQRRAQLREMVDYIAAIHHHIDPDRYDIDPAFLQTLLALISQDGWEDTTLMVGHGDALAIENIADAAGTYTHRGDEPLMDGVSSDDCWEFIEWFGRATRGLYQSTRPPS